MMDYEYELPPHDCSHGGYKVVCVEIEAYKKLIAEHKEAHHG